MKPQVLLIHGFNVGDRGVGSVGELRGYYASLDIPYHILDYGRLGLIGTATRNDNVARQVAEFVSNAEEPVILVGHSNGCAIIHLAITLYGAKPVHSVFINPALDPYTELAPVCSYDVWHSPSDRPVRWAEFLPKHKFRPWGKMGAIGSHLGKFPYSEEDYHDVINYNKESHYVVSSYKHSDVFSSEKVSYFGPLITQTSVERALRRMSP